MVVPITNLKQQSFKPQNSVMPSFSAPTPNVTTVKTSASPKAGGQRIDRGQPYKPTPEQKKIEKEKGSVAAYGNQPPILRGNPTDLDILNSDPSIVSVERYNSAPITRESVNQRLQKATNPLLYKSNKGIDNIENRKKRENQKSSYIPSFKNSAQVIGGGALKLSSPFLSSVPVVGGPLSVAADIGGGALIGKGLGEYGAKAIGGAGDEVSSSIGNIGAVIGGSASGLHGSSESNVSGYLKSQLPSDIWSSVPQAIGYGYPMYEALRGTKQAFDKQKIENELSRLAAIRMAAGRGMIGSGLEDEYYNMRERSVTNPLNAYMSPLQRSKDYLHEAIPVALERGKKWSDALSGEREEYNKYVAGVEEVASKKAKEEALQNKLKKDAESMLSPENPFKVWGQLEDKVKSIIEKSEGRQ